MLYFSFAAILALGGIGSSYHLFDTCCVGLLDVSILLTQDDEHIEKPVSICKVFEKCSENYDPLPLRDKIQYG